MPTLTDHTGWTPRTYTAQEVDALMRQESGWQDFGNWVVMWGWCLLIVLVISGLCWWETSRRRP